MLTLGTKVRAVAFAVIALVVVAYAGVRYANLGHYLGIQGYYVVRVDLAQAGGIFTNAEVTYRGVPVGRVGPMRLTADGIQVDLHIDDSAPPIPADAKAVVANRSAVGEQYVDLRPERTGEPYLTDGSTIQRADTVTPIPVTTLLTSIDRFATSVPAQSLRTVVDELHRAFAGQGQNLQVLLDTGSSYTATAAANIEPTEQLIDNSQTVLATQREASAALASFSRDLRLLAEQLHASDADLRRLIATAPQATTQLAGLLRDTDPALSVMLANLLTTADLALTRQDGIEQTLALLPAVVAAGSTAITPNGANFGLALTFFNPLPCTAGYESTTYRNGLDTSPGQGLNTEARCAAPASSGINVRGSAHAPDRGVPPAAKPGSPLATGAPSSTGLPGPLALPALPDGPSTMAGLLGVAR
jgi:phospholipid/cholesterol/gamma-HCH transport system substrate-binding protein